MTQPSGDLQELFHHALGLTDDGLEVFLTELHQRDPDRARQLERLLTIDRTERDALKAYQCSAAPEAIGKVLPGLLPEGQRLGVYRIDSLLGSGGMGQVYRAVRCDGEVEQTVAIKLVRPDRFEPGVLARFSSERRLLASLRHPGICAFLDAGSRSDGFPYVVMEYVEGETLLDYCQRRHLSIRGRLHLLRQILAAVSHAHARLVVHRDIKPSNVLVTVNGEAKLLDFGIGKSLAEPDPTHTATDQRFLTPQNAAPELLRGEATGIACDIYALGVLAYELLSGQPPFRFLGLRGAEIEHLILAKPPPPISQRASDEAARERSLAGAQALTRRLRGDLDAIVSRCLRKQPGERYPDVRELDEDIARHLSRRPIRARRGDRWYRLSRFVDRHRLASALTGALALSLSFGGFGLLRQATELARQRDAALLERNRAEQVVSILHDAFLNADPTRITGADVRLRDVLNAARHRVYSLAPDQPDLFVSLAGTLASVELALSSDTNAAEIALRGIAAAQSINTEPEAIHKLRVVAARALAGSGDYRSSYEQLEAIPEHRRRHPDWLVARGKVSYEDFDLQASIGFLQEAVSMLKDTEPNDELANYARWQLAAALNRNGQHQEALDLLEATHSWQVQGLSEDHPRTLLTQIRRLHVELQHGDSNDLLRELSEIADKVSVSLGEYHTATGFARSMLGRALEQAGQRERSLVEYRQAWSIWRRTLGDGHANTLRLGQNLAMALAVEPDSLEEAEAVLRQLLAQSEQQFEPARALTVFLRTSLVQVLRLAGRPHEALGLLATDQAVYGAKVDSATSRQFQIDEIVRTLSDARCGVVPLQDPDCDAVRSLLQQMEIAGVRESSQ